MRRFLTLATAVAIATLGAPLPAGADAPPAATSPSQGPVAQVAEAVAEAAVAPPTSVDPALRPPADAEYVAVPVVREGSAASATFLLALRPASYGITGEDLVQAGLPVVAAPEQDGPALADVAHLAVPIDRATTAVAKLGARRAESDSAATLSATGFSAAASISSFALTIFVDTTNNDASRTVARQAWTDARTVLVNEGQLKLANYLYTENAIAFPNDTARRTTAVSDDCHLQRYAEWEATFTGRARGIVVFSNGKMRPQGYDRDVYGLARDGDITRPLSRGASWDYCGPHGTWRSPAYLPRAYVSTDLSASQPFTEKPAPSHWAAHEIAHLYGMRHDHTDPQGFCVTSIQHAGGAHAYLEAASGETIAGCPHWSMRHFHYTFTSPTRTLMHNEQLKLDGCEANATNDPNAPVREPYGWCTGSAFSSPSKVVVTEATPGNQQVTLKWHAPVYGGSGPVAGYCVNVGLQNGFAEPTGREECEDASDTTMVIDDLSNNTPYWFYVRAYNGESNQHGFEGDGPRSDYISATPRIPCVPNAPGTPAVTGSAQTSLTLSWSASTNCSLQHYRVYRSTDPADPGVEVPTASTCYRRTTTSCTDSGLSPSTTYYYRVSAVATTATGGTEGARSGQGSGTTAAPPANDCGSGTDAGNSHATATSVTVPKTDCPAGLVSGDVDWYQFPVTSGQTINASMTPNANADFDICLVDPNGTQVGGCTIGGNGITDTITHQASTGGNWRIQVKIWSGTGSYTLSLSTTGGGGGGSTPTSNPADAPRLVGNESFVFQMDSDDHNQPATARTRDSAPGGKHATLNNATLTTVSKFGHAYSLAGSNQWISVPETGAMSTGTVMMWVYPTSTAGGARLMYKQKPGVYNEFALVIGTDNKVYFQTSQSSPSLGSTSTVPLNAWTHVAVTWGSSGKRIYLNGTLAGSNSDTTGVGSNYDQTMIGNSPNDKASGGYNGALDEVREYTTALTQADVQSLKDLPYVGTGGASSNPAHGPRLLGNELFAYQMDADDHNVPSAGRTRDSCPNAAHGDLVGVSSTTSGKFGSAYTFAGANTFVSVPQTQTARPSGTIMMWVHPTSLSNGGRLFYHQQPGVANQLVLALDSSGRVYFQTTNDGTKGFLSSSTLPLNQWSHVAVTWSSSGQQIYVNGTAAGSGTNTAGVGSGYTHTYIGNSPNDVETGGFTGRIDEVREYSSALSQADVQSIKDLPYFA